MLARKNLLSRGLYIGLTKAKRPFDSYEMLLYVLVDSQHCFGLHNYFIAIHLSLLLNPFLSDYKIFLKHTENRI